tara:strand:+ start:50 stop:331 length:282 start_codon:yes stop_codon:yes gene_type:complete
MKNKYLKIGVVSIFLKKVNFGSKKITKSKRINNSIDHVKKCGINISSSAIHVTENTTVINIKKISSFLFRSKPTKDKDKIKSKSINIKVIIVN